MDSWQAKPDPRQMGTRRQRGWRLTKAAWGLAHRDPTLVPLSLAAAGSCLVATAASIAAIDAVADGGGRGNGAQLVLVVLTCTFFTTFVCAFLAVAMAHAANGSFEGLPPTVPEALAEARETLAPIAIWALISAAILIVAQLVGTAADLGRLLTFLATAAWGFLVAYVSPMIALEGARAGDAIPESARLARRRWGEQLTGGIAIFVVTMLAAFAAGFILALGVGAVDGAPVLGAILILNGTLGLGFILLVSFATSQAFLVALYRLDRGESTLDELASPLSAEAPGWGPARRIAGMLGGILLVMTLVVVLVPTDRNTPTHSIYTEENGYFYTYFDEGERVPLGPGSPVVYHGEAVGSVVEVRLEDGRILVWFHSPPHLDDAIHEEAITVAQSQGTFFLVIGPPGAVGDTGLGPA